jgi:hypothetical protein
MVFGIATTGSNPGKARKSFFSDKNFRTVSVVQRPVLYLVTRLRMCGAVLATLPLICFHGMDRF